LIPNSTRRNSGIGFQQGPQERKNRGKSYKIRVNTVFVEGFSLLILKHEAKSTAYSNSALKTAVVLQTFSKIKIFKNRRRGPQASTKRTEAEGKYGRFLKIFIFLKV
jgi:hypothetical protein